MGTKVIPREARRITYSTEIRNLKKSLLLDKYQTAVVIGSILGDGTLCENWSKTNYRLGIRHSIKQREYVFWKYHALKEWVLSAPKEYNRTKSIWFRTISHPILTHFRSMFYDLLIPSLQYKIG